MINAENARRISKIGGAIGLTLVDIENKIIEASINGQTRIYLKNSISKSDIKKLKNNKYKIYKNYIYKNGEYHFLNITVSWF